MLKIKPYIIHIALTSIILFLLVVLLEENHNYSLYVICISTSLSSLFIGINNSISLTKLGFGKTRKELEKEFVIETLICIVITLILILLDMLFIFIVYNSFDVLYRVVILSYLASISLSLLVMFALNIKKRTKTLIIVLSISIVIVVVLYLIKNEIIIDIILLLISVFLYFLNKYIIKNLDII